MKKHFRNKHKARKLVLQGLYSLLISKNNITNIKNELLFHQNKNKIDITYFLLLIENISKKSLIFERIIHKNLKINTQITLIENIIIKIALFEIFFNEHLNFKIIINEALILSNTFCSKKSYMLINKTLNNLIKSYGTFKLMI